MKSKLLASAFCLFALSLAIETVQVSAQSDKPDATSTTAAARSNIAVENWTKPQSGWLYVLDPEPKGASHIWLIDPATGKIMGSIRTGENPDFALSPDGNRLYVAAITEGDSSEIAGIDTSRGAIVQRGNVEYREVGNVLPSFSMMAVSGDGLALRIVLDTPESSDRDMFLLATFDTESGEFLPANVRLYNCGPGRFISYPSADRFDVLCPRTNKIRLITVDAESQKAHDQEVVLPWERRVGVAEAIELPGSDNISIVRGDGAVVAMKLDSLEFGDTAAREGLPNRVPPAAWPVSPDGSRVYLGYNNLYDRHYDNRFYLDYGRAPNLRPNDALAAEFRVLDARTWKKIGTIRTKMPFWSAVISNDGRLLYALAPHKHSILVIDTEKMNQINLLKVGGTPALALVAP